MISSHQNQKESKLELGISYVLASGVLASLILMISGILLFYLEFGNLAISERKGMFLQEKNFFYFLYDLFGGGNFQGRALWTMTMGIVALILTPYAWVIMSVLYFLKEKDFKFFLVALLVFLIITLSLATH